MPLDCSNLDESAIKVIVDALEHSTKQQRLAAIGLPTFLENEVVERARREKYLCNTLLRAKSAAVISDAHLPILGDALVLYAEYLSRYKSRNSITSGGSLYYLDKTLSSKLDIILKLLASIDYEYGGPIPLVDSSKRPSGQLDNKIHALLSRARSWIEGR